jgi:L-alanine-DL-glutamate epimerase-like enolase superfamily enzyme
MFELPLPVADFAFAGLTGIRPGPDGRVALPAGPGLGIELDWGRIEAEAEHVFDSL